MVNTFEVINRLEDLMGKVYSAPEEQLHDELVIEMRFLIQEVNEFLNIDFLNGNPMEIM